MVLQSGWLLAALDTHSKLPLVRPDARHMSGATTALRVVHIRRLLTESTVHKQLSRQAAISQPCAKMTSTEFSKCDEVLSAVYTGEGAVDTKTLTVVRTLDGGNGIKINEE